MHIKEIMTSKLKLGLANFANKGSCAIRFNYKESSLAFACTHLDSGQVLGMDVQRRQQLENIIRNIFVNERGTNMSKYNWNSHDVKLIFGDLNFRNTS